MASADLQWLFYSGERILAHGPFVGFFTVWKASLWLHLWNWCGWLPSNVLPPELDEYDWCINRLYSQCSWLLSSTNGHTVFLISVTLIKVSTNC